ncbi:hypothetical protein ACIRL2_47100 [Embleya sp. NPDC127516]|uniref:hypothetical protein n=1 Tax=Embleya sp. NPDC127516 TaxID=3363990 RepID=UPI0037F117CB
MKTIRRTLASAVIGIGLMMGALAVPAAAAQPVQVNCYQWNGYQQFASNTPWHTEPYGRSPVVSRGGGSVLITYYCINDYGNYWYMRSSGLYAYESYLE